MGFGGGRPDVAGRKCARGVVADVQPEQVEPMAAHEAVGVVEGVFVGRAVTHEVHFHLHGEQVLGQAPLETLQDLPVDAVGIDLHVVEIGPAAFRQKVGHDHGLVRIGEPGQLPGIVPELLLRRCRLKTGVTDLARAHEAHAVAHLHDQGRGRAGGQIDRLVGAGAHEGRHVGDLGIVLFRGETLAFACARIDAQCLQPVAEGTPFWVEAAGAADVEQREAFRLQPLGDQCKERHRVPDSDRGDRSRGRAHGAGQAQRWRRQQEARPLPLTQP